MRNATDYQPIRRGVLVFVALAALVAFGPLARSQDSEAPEEGIGQDGGRILEYVVQDGALSHVPVPGATVIIGAGLWLDAQADGRDVITGGAPDALLTTEADGTFALPSLTESANLIVWRSGYLPALRTIDPGSKGLIEIVLCRQDRSAGLRHSSLAREDGRLIFGSVAPRLGEVYADIEHGVLVDIPQGYSQLHVDDDYTFLRLAKGKREISIVDLKQEFDPKSLGRMLHGPGEHSEVKLLENDETSVDGAWALRREFQSRVGRTILIYATRAGAYYVFILYTPDDERKEAEAEFEEFLGSLCFVGKKPKVPSGFRGVKHPVWGYTAYLPKAWEWSLPDDPSASLQAMDPDEGAALVLSAQRVDAGMAPSDVLEEALAQGRADTPELLRERLLLVDGQQGIDRAYTTSSGRFLRAAAVVSDGIAYTFIFDLPDGEGEDLWEDATVVLRTFRLRAT